MLRALCLFVLLIPAVANAFTVGANTPGTAEFSTAFGSETVRYLNFTFGFNAANPLSPSESFTVTVYNSSTDAFIGQGSYTNTSGIDVKGCAGCIELEAPNLSTAFYIKIESNDSVAVDTAIAEVAGDTVYIDDGTLSIGAWVPPTPPGEEYDYAANTPFTWVKVADSDPVAAITSALTTAGLTCCGQGTDMDGGADIESTVNGSFVSWSAGIYAEGAGKFYHPWGGGHCGSTLNGVWELDLVTMEWSVNRMPSDTSAWASTYWAPCSGGPVPWSAYINDSFGSIDTLPTGDPTSRHNYGYNFYDTSRGLIGNGRFSMWTYDPVSQAAPLRRDFINNATEALLNPGVGGNMTHDAVTDRIFGLAPSLFGGNATRWIVVDPTTGRFAEDSSPLRVTPTCMAKNDRTIYLLGGTNGLQWAEYDMDLGAIMEPGRWTQGAITDLPAHDASQEMQVCVYVPQVNKILRQFLNTTLDENTNEVITRGDWYWWDPASHTHEKVTFAGDVPVGRFAADSVFYYPPGQSIVYVQATTPGETPRSDNAVFVMNVLEEEPPPDNDWPVITYNPQNEWMPDLGDYSVEGVCESIHDPAQVASVTYRDADHPTETLKDAYNRLKAIANDVDGGIIYVPWNTDTLACDHLNFYASKTADMEGGFSLIGQLGPQKQMPRFYCRKDTVNYANKVWDFGGTIPNITSKFIGISSWAGPTRVLMENIHVDGYETAVSFSSGRKLVVRNNYIHHGTSNAIWTPDQAAYDDSLNPLNPAEYDRHVEICGNEISHSGNQTKHLMYLHQNPSLKTADTTWDTYQTVVDNYLHSGVACSAVKIVAEFAEVHNNRIDATASPDPSYDTFHASLNAAIEMAACADSNVTGNVINWNQRPANDVDTPVAGRGTWIMGFRQRAAAMRGCTTPVAYDMEPLNGPVDKTAGSRFWDPAWWATLNGEKQFFHNVTGNTITIPADSSGDQGSIFQHMGTYPLYAEGSDSFCFLEAPDEWYERSIVVLRNNVTTDYKGSVNVHYEGENNNMHLYNPFCSNYSPPGDRYNPETWPPGPGPETDQTSFFDVDSSNVFTQP